MHISSPNLTIEFGVFDFRLRKIELATTQVSQLLNFKS